MRRKKPVYIVKNAHALSSIHQQPEQSDVEKIPNGCIGKCVPCVLLVIKYGFFTMSSIAPFFLTDKHEI